MSESQRATDTDDGRPKLADTMAIGTELWIVVILAEIAAYVGQYPMFVDMMRQTVNNTPDLTPEQANLMTSSGLIVTAMVISGAVLTAVSATFVWLARKGYNWARYLVIAMSVFISVRLLFTLVPLLSGNLEGALASPWVMIPTVISGVAAIGATVMLMRADSDRYCRDMADYRRRAKTPQWQGAQGQGPGQWPPYDQGPYQPGPPQQGPPQQWPPQQSPPQQWPPQQWPPQQWPQQAPRNERDDSDGRS